MSPRKQSTETINSLVKGPIESLIPKFQRDFLVEMHPYFGLQRPPKNLRVEIGKPLKNTKANFFIEDKKIVLETPSKNHLNGGEYEQADWNMTTTFSLAHELGHYLHSKTQPEFYNRNLNGAVKPHVIRELIGELTAIIYLDRAQMLQAFQPFGTWTSEDLYLEAQKRYVHAGRKKSEQILRNLANMQIKDIPPNKIKKPYKWDQTLEILAEVFK